MENNLNLANLLGLFAEALTNAQNNNNNVDRQPVNNAPVASANNNPLADLLQGLLQQNNNYHTQRPVVASNNNEFNPNNLMKTLGDLFGGMTNTESAPRVNNQPNFNSALNRALQGNDSVPRQQDTNETNPLSALLSSVLPALSSFASNREAQPQTEDRSNSDNEPFGNLDFAFNNGDNASNNNDTNVPNLDALKPIFNAFQPNNNQTQSNNEQVQPNVNNLLSNLGVNKAQAGNIVKGLGALLLGLANNSNNSNNNGDTIRL